MNVKKHYDKEAERYVEKFSKGLFGLIRKKEKEAVFELLDPQTEEKILDAGCGAGFYSVPLKNIGSKPFGVDISPKMIEKIKGFSETAACLIKPRYFANSTACQPSLAGGKDKGFFSHPR